MKILVVGGGGREHAMAWRIARSKRVQRAYVAPGNGGTAQDPDLVNVPIDPVKQMTELADFVVKEGIAMTVVGPEAPLAAAMGLLQPGGDEAVRYGIGVEDAQQGGQVAAGQGADDPVVATRP